MEKHNYYVIRGKSGMGGWVTGLRTRAEILAWVENRRPKLTNKEDVWGDDLYGGFMELPNGREYAAGETPPRDRPHGRRVRRGEKKG
jgi:hypothetical protein